ncbi:hypothetical protein DFA_05144 [Cavenderia fasciculata]|uniref:Transmembrane protein n=1 Tax=Cavenderia fasciculata TaxID=261658 RepID=F4PNG1_CACFS|nr:uncharacterized protein DFA_05144 [Cavenderia fasciculata]EGG23014.1 hypothetical protein DFA_05144 [Cavenderia fasciculata]|eukprot:XP_004360865.1 hypothetical protein DFA_05144 [Cavenderia fasciculata]
MNHVSTPKQTKKPSSSTSSSPTTVNIDDGGGIGITPIIIIIIIRITIVTLKSHSIYLFPYVISIPSERAHIARLVSRAGPSPTTTSLRG